MVALLCNTQFSHTARMWKEIVLNVYLFCQIYVSFQQKIKRKKASPGLVS